jgi:predicted nucleic acid-binding protein
MNTAGDQAGRPKVVLDTHVVLDCLLFADRHAAPLWRAITSGAWQWVATAPMREELEYVLRRGLLRHRVPDHEPLLQIFDSTAVQLPASAESEMSTLRCKDASDQKFIDLALRETARALVSRDREVLKLARRASQYGLQIVKPEGWSALDIQATLRC